MPDAELNSELWEFKRIENAKTSNISNAVQNHFNRASKNGGQSPNIVLHICQVIITETLISGLERSLKDDKKRYFQKIIIIHKSKILFLYRRDVHFGKAKRKIIKLFKN